MKRCEHNCHLCKNEWLGRCFGSKHYGKDVSLSDVPICDEYVYGGSEEHLKEIEEATKTNGMQIDRSYYTKLKSMAGAWDTIEKFFETEEVLKDIYQETVSECLKDNCQSTAIMMILTIKKLMDYAELE